MQLIIMKTKSLKKVSGNSIEHLEFYKCTVALPFDEISNNREC